MKARKNKLDNKIVNKNNDDDDYLIDLGFDEINF